VLEACPNCQRTFPPGEAARCPHDGTAVVPIVEVPTPRDPKDPYVGHTVAGKYQIRRIVADGAMGRVYEARQLAPDRRIAVKILHANVAEDDVNIERFKREAETSRALKHEHVVEVIDFDQEVPAPGRPSGAWYLAMEFLDGEELRALLDRKKQLPVARALRVVSQVATALDRAHEQGMVHRDLKPDNIFLVHTPNGDEVKLLDFGSVKYTKGQDRGNKLTVMGTTIGSPFYMSPEQARGEPDLDGRADVWAMGAILYEMTVGHVPFKAANSPQILFKILGEEPMPPSFARDDAPAQLDDIMIRALAKKRLDRFATVGALADALGHGFGLTGSHREWAATPESKLTEQLGTAAPAPIPAATPKSSGPVANEPAPRRGPAAPSVGARARETARASAADIVPDDYSPIPKGPPVALYAAVAAFLLVVVALAYFGMK
jgi:serine/threonine protein kinase